MGAALQADGENEVRICGLKHQKEKRSMDHFAGLDVSVKDTSVCIVDDTGKIVREVKVASEPGSLLAVLKNPGYRFKRIGLEAGPLSRCSSCRPCYGYQSRWSNVSQAWSCRALSRRSTSLVSGAGPGAEVVRGTWNRRMVATGWAIT